MKALLLAAGKGSRLGAVSGGVPKPLVDVGGTSPLQHAVSWTAAERPECIWINVHTHGDRVRERIGSAIDGVPILYSHEPELLGTAGAWKKLEEEWTETSLVVYGDNFMRFELRALQAAHARGGGLVTIALFDPARHASTGTVGGRAVLENGRVTEFIEGGGDGMVNAGAYCIEPELRGRLSHGLLDFGHDVLPRLALQGELAGHVVEEGAYCLGIDDPARLSAARALLRQGLEVVR
ncbi:MAG: nucleotidyltransferase family protein [Longimicrobiales bacterium]